MKNQRFSRNMFGDLPTQKMAQKALPILITCAQKGDKILLRDLARKITLTPPFNWTMRWVLAWIHTTLYELQRQDDWECGEIPGITAIVLAGHREPTSWEAIQEIQPDSWEEYRAYHIQPVFEYPYWGKVMDYVVRNLPDRISGSLLLTSVYGMEFCLIKY